MQFPKKSKDSSTFLPVTEEITKYPTKLLFLLYSMASSLSTSLSNKGRSPQVPNNKIGTCCKSRFVSLSLSRQHLNARKLSLYLNVNSKNIPSASFTNILFKESNLEAHRGESQTSNDIKSSSIFLFIEIKEELLWS